MSEAWRPHLDLRRGEIDFHPETYHSPDAEVVVRDALAIVHASEDLGLERCTLICGRGARKPRGSQGTLLAQVERALRPQVGRKIAHLSRDRSGGALEVIFAWPALRKANLERANTTSNRLRELPGTPSSAGLPRVRSMLDRVYREWGIPPEFHAPLGNWGLLARDHAGLPSSLRSELVLICLRWGFVELLSFTADIPQRTQAANDLLGLADAPGSLRETLSLVESDEDWNRCFLPELEVCIRRACRGAPSAK